jgi:hypothetical protein
MLTDSSCSDSSVNEGKSSLPRVFGEKLNALLHQYNDSLKINHYRLVQRQYEFAQLYRKLKLFIRSKIICSNDGWDMLKSFL